MSSKQRIIQGLGANGFGQVVTILIQLASVPIMIHAWGVELYGEWVTLSALPSYLALSNIGLTATAGNSLAMLSDKDDPKHSQEIYQSTWVMVNVLSFGAFTLLTAIILYFNLKSVFDFNLTSNSVFNFTLIALLLNVVMSMQTGIFEIAFRAIKKNPFAIFFSNLIRLFEWIAATIMVLIGGSFISVAIIMSLIRLLGNLLFWIILLKSNSPLKIGIRYASLKHIKQLIRPALATMCFPLGLSMSMQGMILLINHQLGSAAVTLFSVYRTFTRVPVQIGKSITLAVAPEISYLKGKNDLIKAKRLIVKTLLNCIVLGIVTTLAIQTLGEYVIDIWVTKKIVHNPNLLLVLALAAFAHIVLQPVWVAQMAINKHIRFALFFLLISFLSLILAWFYMGSLGVNGAGYAVLTNECALVIAGYMTYKLHYGTQSETNQNLYKTSKNLD